MVVAEVHTAGAVEEKKAGATLWVEASEEGGQVEAATEGEGGAVAATGEAEPEQDKKAARPAVTLVSVEREEHSLASMVVEKAEASLGVEIGGEGGLVAAATGVAVMVVAVTEGEGGGEEAPV